MIPTVLTININFDKFWVVRGCWRQAKKTHNSQKKRTYWSQNKNPLREWCDNQSKKFDDKKFSDLFYEQVESTSKKLSIFSEKIGKNIEYLEIDDLVLLVQQR